VLNRIALQAGSRATALSAAGRAGRACLAIGLHIEARLAPGAGSSGLIAPQTQILTAARANAVLEQSAGLAPCASLRVAALHAAIRLTLRASCLIFLEEACLAFVTLRGAWNRTVCTVLNLARAIDALIVVLVVPEFRGTLLTLL